MPRHTFMVINTNSHLHTLILSSRKAPTPLLPPPSSFLRHPWHRWPHLLCSITLFPYLGLETTHCVARTLGFYAWGSHWSVMLPGGPAPLSETRWQWLDSLGTEAPRMSVTQEHFLQKTPMVSVVPVFSPIIVRITILSNSLHRLVTKLTVCKLFYKILSTRQIKILWIISPNTK